MGAAFPPASPEGEADGGQVAATCGKAKKEAAPWEAASRTKGSRSGTIRYRREAESTKIGGNDESAIN